MKYHIITIGCQMNKADSERIAGYLEDLGYEWTKSRTQADLVVLTTCGVRQSAEDRIYGLISKIKKENKFATRRSKILLTGCLSEREDVRKRLKGEVDIWLPAREISRLAEKLNPPHRQLASPSQKGTEVFDYLKLRPKRNSKFSAFVPIGNGCNNFCSYCVVPYARGREVYRSADEIIKELEGLIKKGCKEINLIAQNVNSYVSSQKSKIINFPNLLKLADKIPGDFWIRFATSHPKDMSDDLIDVISECDKVCKYVHLPVQSGDNEILDKMNRKYMVEHYKGLIKKIRKKIPKVAVSTDIIVGFPGETEEQFKNTLKLFQEIEYDLAYIAQYSSRYGTEAAKMADNISLKEKRRRNDILEDLLRKTALANNKKQLGRELRVLVEGKDRKDFWKGKTETYKNVRVKSDGLKAGDFVQVKINKADVFGLEGEVVN